MENAAFEITALRKVGIWAPMELTRKLDFATMVQLFIYCKRNPGAANEGIIVDAMQNRIMIIDNTKKLLLGEIYFDWTCGAVMLVPGTGWGNIQIMKFLDEMLEKALVRVC